MTSLVARLLLVVVAPAAMAAAQIGDHAPVPPTWNQRPGSAPTPNVRPTETSAATTVDLLRAEQLSKVNRKHQEQAKADAARLLELATELKKEVDGLNVSTTSAKATPDTDKIIALAKSIKGNLRQY